MSNLKDTILLYGQSNDLKSLRKLLNNTAENELISLMKKNIVSGSFVQLLNYILQGLSNSLSMNSKKLNLTIQTLKALDDNEVPTSQVNDIVNYINADLPKYNSECLVEFSNFCLESLQNNKCNQYSWKEIFLKL
ncbi:hypothetical protein HHI36_012758 [Cryptolaemus montrouzieri]|uniref:FANCI solenoid 1 domain-containing protein n=1 Tax=Cryptolaemus montrouzieri TaxID=559131 RepID=A0ABD2NFN1_9CUCU